MSGSRLLWLCLLIANFLSLNAYPKATTVKVKLNVHSIDSIHVGKLELSYFQTSVDSISSSGSFQINKKGYGEKKFEFNTIIHIQEEYFGYTIIDTVIQTGRSESISLVFELHPRYIPYSDSLAVDDIIHQSAKIIIHDKRLYNANRRFRFTKQFGFDYVYEENPFSPIKDKDAFAVAHYEPYNKRVLQYLDANFPQHKSLLPGIVDSFMNYDADSLGISRPIECNNIHLPETAFLPTEFRKWVMQVQEGNRQANARTESDPYEYVPQVFSASETIARIKTEKDVFVLTDIDLSIVYNYKETIPLLICELDNNTFVGNLNIEKNDRQVVFNGRQKTLYFLPGYLGKDDAGTVAGRVNYLLKNLTKEISFGDINASSTQDELKKIRNRWAYYFSHLDEWE